MKPRIPVAPTWAKALLRTGKRIAASTPHAPNQIPPATCTTKAGQTALYPWPSPHDHVPSVPNTTPDRQRTTKVKRRRLVITSRQGRIGGWILLRMWGGSLHLHKRPALGLTLCASGRDGLNPFRVEGRIPGFHHRHLTPSQQRRIAIFWPLRESPIVGSMSVVTIFPLQEWQHASSLWCYPRFGSTEAR